MAERVDIHSVSALRNFDSRFMESGETVAQWVRRCRAAARDCLADVEAEVARRQQAVDQCEEHCGPLIRRLEEAQRARQRLVVSMQAAEQAARPAAMSASGRHRDGHAYMQQLAGTLMGIRPGMGTVASGVAGVPSGADGSGSSGGTTSTGGATASGGTPAGPPGTLGPGATTEMTDALRDYSRIGVGEHINHCRRHGGEMTASERATEAGVEKAFGAVHPTTDAMTLHRGVGAEFLTSLGVSPHASTSEALSALNSGAEARDHGFISTSSEWRKPFVDRAVLLDVHVPPGTHAVDMTSKHPDGATLSAVPTEKEWLLPSGSLVIVPGSAHFDGTRYHARAHYYGKDD